MKKPSLYTIVVSGSYQVESISHVYGNKIRIKAKKRFGVGIVNEYYTMEYYRRVVGDKPQNHNKWEC